MGLNNILQGMIKYDVSCVCARFLPLSGDKGILSNEVTLMDLEFNLSERHSLNVS